MIATNKGRIALRETLGHETSVTHGGHVLQSLKELVESDLRVVILLQVF